MEPWWKRFLKKLKAALFGPCAVGQPEPDSCKDRRTVQWLVPYLVVIMLLALHVLVQAWPEGAAPLPSATPAPVAGAAPSPSPTPTVPPATPEELALAKLEAMTIHLLWGLIDWRLGSEGVRFLVLALAAGALGGAIHAASSLARFSVRRGPVVPGDPDLSPLHHYFTWYLLRPVVAMGLAVVVQLLIVAGIFDVKPATAGAAVVAGVAALVGMFSARVNKKLGDIADTLFGEEDQKKEDQKAAPLVSLHVTPYNVQLLVGETSPLAAETVHSDDGASADVTHQVTWASANAQIATVSSSGLVAAVAPGTTTISAARGQVTSNPVTVTVKVP